MDVFVEVKVLTSGEVQITLKRVTKTVCSIICRKTTVENYKTCEFVFGKQEVFVRTGKVCKEHYLVVSCGDAVLKVFDIFAIEFGW